VGQKWTQIASHYELYTKLTFVPPNTIMITFGNKLENDVVEIWHFEKLEEWLHEIRSKTWTKYSILVLNRAMIETIHQKTCNL